MRVVIVSVPPALHRLERVAREVQEDLRQAVGVGEQLGDRRVEVALDAHARAERIHREQVEHVVEHAVDVHAARARSLRRA